MLLGIVAVCVATAGIAVAATTDRRATFDTAADVAAELADAGLCGGFVEGVPLTADSEGTCDEPGLNVYVVASETSVGRTLTAIEEAAMEFDYLVMAVVGDRWIVSRVVGTPATETRSILEDVQEELGGELRDDVSGMSTASSAEIDFVSYVRRHFEEPFAGTEEQVAVLGYLFCDQIIRFAPDYDTLLVVSQADADQYGLNPGDVRLALVAAAEFLCPEHHADVLAAVDRAGSGQTAVEPSPTGPSSTVADTVPVSGIDDVVGLSGRGSSAALPPQTECTAGASVCFYLNRIDWDSVVVEITAAIQQASGVEPHDGFEPVFYGDPPESYNGPDRTGPGSTLLLDLPFACLVTVEIVVLSETDYEWTVRAVAPADEECGA